MKLLNNLDIISEKNRNIDILLEIPNKIFNNLYHVFKIWVFNGKLFYCVNCKRLILEVYR